MRVLEHGLNRIYFDKRHETKLEHSVYSKDDCDLRFTYQKGSETRGIWLELNREEAKQLLKFLDGFLSEPWEEPRHGRT